MMHLEVVCALIQNVDGKIFCCQRGPGRALEGKWEFPGGKIETSETKEQAIVREIKEELKSEIEILKYIGVSNYKYTELEKSFSITMYAYLCKLVSGELELTEHISSKWCSIDEMMQMDFAEADLFLISFLNSL